MEQLGRAVSQIRTRVWLLAAAVQIFVGLGFLWLYHTRFLPLSWTAGLYVAMSITSTYLVASGAAHYAAAPLKAFGDAILHVSPSQNPSKAPNTDNLHIGQQYVTAMVYQLYQIASLQDNKLLAEHKREATQASNILTRLPLPLFVFNKQQIITFASESAINYTERNSAELFGKPIFEAMDLEFPTDFTLETWINDCQKNKATDNAYWKRVRLTLKNESGTLRQCDLAGYYNRDNPTGIEFIVTLFDRSEEYAQDDQALSFIALAVHELRTPLTLMRGLIEVFEDELEGKLDPEMTTFMERLRGSAEQLTAFVNNILNVARIEENQLPVKLAEEKWEDIIKHAGEDMELKAKGLGKTIHVDMAASVPTVAADRVTMYEVLCNLLDNAIKYSGTAKDITIHVGLTKDGLVETIVEDHGVGIPTSVIPTLFEKFHRNHRNKDTISGTGLGLYLSKAIVNAHGGDIWVKSKENEGTTVGFTLQPYSQLADELKSGNNKDDMVRTAHGWIKNHSLYRR
ncbi:MAG TPA: HAMP domain-containing sensor histidine kinase [Patescibacteria group bacterium]|nr:HAMP domain-containing sensor histidine kinase [Patescibacteria group bacterium]